MIQNQRKFCKINKYHSEKEGERRFAGLEVKFQMREELAREVGCSAFVFGRPPSSFRNWSFGQSGFQVRFFRHLLRTDTRCFFLSCVSFLSSLFFFRHQKEQWWVSSIRPKWGWDYWYARRKETGRWLRLLSDEGRKKKKRRKRLVNYRCPTQQRCQRKKIFCFSIFFSPVFLSLSLLSSHFCFLFFLSAFLSFCFQVDCQPVVREFRLFQSSRSMQFFLFLGLFFLPPAQAFQARLQQPFDPHFPGNFLITNYIASDSVLATLFESTEEGLPVIPVLPPLPSRSDQPAAGGEGELVLESAPDHVDFTPGILAIRSILDRQQSWLNRANVVKKGDYTKSKLG